MNAFHSAPGDQSGTPTIYNVVYCSRATPGVGEADVQRIVAGARRFNPENGITGMLVFGSGIFFQWLEGPRANVQVLMAKLRADKRHDQIIELSEVEEVRDRLFPDWDMELVTADHIREVLQDARDNSTDPIHQGALDRLLAHLDSGALSGLTTA
jgi:hypothetical protein